MEPLFVAQSAGARWFRIGAYALVALFAVTTVVLTVTAGWVAGISSGLGILAILLFVWAILPKRYEVWPDHLRIVFPAWGWDIAYESIETVRGGHWYEAYGFMGVRFATSPSQSVTILRRNANLLTRPNVVISPEGREEFLRHLRRAKGG